MLFLIFIALLAVAVWAAVFWKHIVIQQLRPIPVMGVGVVIIGAVFGRQFFAIEGPIPITFDRMLLGAMGGLFVLRVLFGKESLKPFDVLDLLILSLTGYMMISTLSHDWTILKKMPLSRLLFFNIAPVTLYFLLKHSLVGVRELKVISVCLIGFGLYLSLTAIAEWRGWTWAVFPKFIADAKQEEFFGRGRGPFMNPVSNGIYMTVSACLLYFWWPKFGRRWRPLFAAMGLLFAIGIYTTLTRSVWLSFVLSAGLLVWLPAAPRFKAIMILLGVFGSFLVVTGFGDALKSFKRDKFVTEAEMQQSASLRPLFLIVAMRMFEDRPLMGCGFGQYPQAKWPYLQDPTSQHQLALTKGYMQHNIFLAYLTELGLIGVTLLCSIMFALAYKAMSLWRDPRRPLICKQFALIMLVILVGHTVNGMFHDVSIAPLVNVLFYFVAGLTASMTSAPAELTNVYAPPPVSFGLSVERRQPATR